MMGYKEKILMAKKVAAILAENEATVADMTDIFSKVKEYLAVSIRPGGMHGDYLPNTGGIYVPDQTGNGDGSGDE